MDVCKNQELSWYFEALILQITLKEVNRVELGDYINYGINRDYF